ncbi:MAG TPA: molybdate ABC transporter substrate-binding protein, partial [Thermoanaerobaculia bacterium]|nr:molybdate ABC transporter substrate-binding protein [Thermoanaerobaculia bacterium]
RLYFFALFLFACTASAAEVRVFAAASLREALTEIAAAYERQSKDKIVFSFGASSLLARQIQEGAPADLFLSADEEKMNALARRGLIEARSRVSVLSNSLVVVVPKTGGKSIASARQLPSLESIALAEPNSVPAGIYAREYLQKIGLWSRLQAKVIPTDNVRSALAAVESGNVDAAIVYKTDALISNEVRVAYEVPRADGPDISYPFALVTNNAASRRFLGQLRSPAALRVFAKYGFVIR